MTSVLVKRVREESERRGWEVTGGWTSRLEMLADCERRRRAVAKPRPEEPPETRKVRSLICMVGGGGSGRGTERFGQGSGKQSADRVLYEVLRVNAVPRLLQLVGVALSCSSWELLLFLPFGRELVSLHSLGILLSARFIKVSVCCVEAVANLG